MWHYALLQSCCNPEKHPSMGKQIDSEYAGDDRCGENDAKVPGREQVDDSEAVESQGDSCENFENSVE